MLLHPQIDPIAFSLGPLAVRWYGLSYMAAFVSAYLIGRWWLNRHTSVLDSNPLNHHRNMTTRDWEDMLFLAVLGVVLGGRLGYILFYKPAFYLSNPLKIFAVWEGGMSFHGGLLGVIAVVIYFAWRRQMSLRHVADVAGIATPLGLMFGRLANFINGELYGRVTDSTLPWIMRFPSAVADDQRYALANTQWMQTLMQAGGLPRHPSQLYQALTEGLLLFVIVLLYTLKPRAEGRVAAVFLMGYGVMRFAVEFTREPDNFLGLLALNLSMGQWLCLPMIALGAYLYASAPKHNY